MAGSEAHEARKVSLANKYKHLTRRGHELLKSEVEKGSRPALPVGVAFQPDSQPFKHRRDTKECLDLLPCFTRGRLGA